MILAVVGPTGVGKTKMSIELAKKYNAIIINCDAVQVYKELDIGSAKVTKSEMEGIKHYLIDFISPSTSYTVYDYQKDLRKILEENKDKNIVLVGGTGLYLKAGLYDYEFKDENINKTYDDLTNEELYQLVIKKDPSSDIHVNNRKRLIRFLNRDYTPKKSEPLYNAIFIGLTTDRKRLYEIINKRVDVMMESGLLEEVKNLNLKYRDSAILNNGIGYKELKRYLNGEISLDEAVEEIKKNSRHYAKRQYTWFNHQLPVNWFNVDYDNFDNTIKEVIEFIEKKKSC